MKQPLDCVTLRGPKESKVQSPKSKVSDAKSGDFAPWTWDLGLSCALMGMLLLAGYVNGASVGPAGYTNAFSTQPSSADWATFTRTGVATDVYDMDADVNANVTA